MTHFLENTSKRSCKLLIINYNSRKFLDFYFVHLLKLLQEVISVQLFFQKQESIIIPVSMKLKIISIYSLLLQKKEALKPQNQLDFSLAKMLRKTVLGFS